MPACLICAQSGFSNVVQLSITVLAQAGMELPWPEGPGCHHYAGPCMPGASWSLANPYCRIRPLRASSLIDKWAGYKKLAAGQGLVAL